MAAPGRWRRDEARARPLGDRLRRARAAVRDPSRPRRGPYAARELVRRRRGGAGRHRSGADGNVLGGIWIDGPFFGFGEIGMLVAREMARSRRRLGARRCGDRVGPGARLAQAVARRLPVRRRGDRPVPEARVRGLGPPPEAHSPRERRAVGPARRGPPAHPRVRAMRTPSGATLENLSTSRSASTSASTTIHARRVSWCRLNPNRGFLGQPCREPP